MGKRRDAKVAEAVDRIEAYLVDKAEAYQAGIVDNKSADFSELYTQALGIKRGAWRSNIGLLALQKGADDERIQRFEVHGQGVLYAAIEVGETLPIVETGAPPANQADLKASQYE